MAIYRLVLTRLCQIFYVIVSRATAWCEKNPWMFLSYLYGFDIWFISEIEYKSHLVCFILFLANMSLLYLSLVKFKQFQQFLPQNCFRNQRPQGS